LTVRRAEPVLDDHPRRQPGRRPIEPPIALLSHHDQYGQWVLEPNAPEVGRRRLDDRHVLCEHGGRNLA
jgi:hypothetical protein